MIAPPTGAVAEESEPTIRPIAASLRGNRGTWRLATTPADCIILRAGFNPKDDAAKVIRLEMYGEMHEFVHLEKNAPWFTRAVGGVSAKNGELRAVSVISVIKHKVCTKTGDDVPDAAVADPCPAGADADDAMNVLARNTPSQQPAAKIITQSTNKNAPK